MPIPTGLCAPWITAEQAASCAEAAGLDADQTGQVAMFASEVLYVLSNRHWPGVCERVIRPAPVNGYWDFICVPAEREWWAAMYSTDPWLGGRGYLQTQWPFRSRDTLRIPGPVAEVTEIRIDNVALAAGDYLVEGRNVLRRLDGLAWPNRQDLTRAPTTTPDPAVADPAPAWAITYDWGAAPPDSGVLACRSFFCEIALALGGSSECSLPWAGAVSSISRQGLSVNYGSLHDQFVNGYVGLADVDLWLNTARGGPWRPRKPRVARADARRRTTGRSTWS